MKKNKRTNKKRPAKRSVSKKAKNLVSLAMHVGQQMADRAFPKLTPVPSRVRFLQEQPRQPPQHYMKPGERFVGQAALTALCPALRTSAGFPIDPAILNAWNNYGRA